MKARKSVKTWEKTRLQSLYKHRDGGFYARFYENGKEYWRPLNTKLFSVAEARIAELQKESRARRTLQRQADEGVMFFGEERGYCACDGCSAIRILIR